ncbi:hypothetical protein [Candidatus Uabimicrobium amorphum]|uniref:Serine protease n=1 Tax=Uabimicrobium amorphum TaxID=2596890 RepID=A0A5S9IJ66_UABAM|nr:hypothetical protein [Candidatus Uabimicrobium amorphum]BBM82859.1 hypothetical protein UABAM_01202 [Candidatus Uabimicrobium amorphum]
MYKLLLLFVMSGLLFAQEQQSETQATESSSKTQKQKILDIVDAHKDAVVSVQLVVKIPSMGNFERKLEIPGTVVNEQGLVIVSNSQADPMVAMRRRFQQGGPQNAKTEFTDIKIICNDNTEVPAQIAMQDEDLDIIFIKPKENKRKFAYISLDKTAKPQLLDDVVVIAKLDASTGRTPMIFHTRVMAIITKPSTYYVIFGISAGVPAFDENGKCFGLLLSRIGGGNAAMTNNSNIASAMAMLPMILPAEDILDVIADLEEEEE